MSDAQLPVEHVPALIALPEIVHGFTLRVPGIEMSHDKAEALARLDNVHRKVRDEHRLGGKPFVTAQQIHGNGLGLSLVRRIIEAHGGKVSATSRVGAGSSFTISLPAADRQVAATAAATSDIRAATHT